MTDIIEPGVPVNETIEVFEPSAPLVEVHQTNIENHKVFYEGMNVQLVPGPQGAVGPAGPQGPQGIKGDPGEGAYTDWLEQGNTGTIADFLATLKSTEVGPMGPQGPEGPTGPQGADSTVPGPKGDTGATGPQGLKGDKGDVGEAGPEGPQGPIGLTGADSTVPGPEGPMGAIGPKGDPGDQGPAGLTGPEGPQGPIGETGPAGADSTVPGPEGPMGPEGPVGPEGPQGPKGDTGEAGPQGLPGVDGAALLPNGGLTGQALIKASDLDQDTEWGDVAAGGGGGGTPSAGFMSYTGANVTFATGTSILTLWNTVDVADEGFTVDTTTGGITVDTDGWYAVTLAIPSTAFAGSARFRILDASNSEELANLFYGDWDYHYNSSWTQNIYLTAGQTIVAELYRSTTFYVNTSYGEPKFGALLLSSGPAGPKGKSNYEIAVANGFVGTEFEWLESIRGPAGFVDGATAGTALAYLSTVAQGSASGYQTIAFDTMTEYDPTFITNLAENTITVTKTGWYSLSGGVWLAAAVSGYKYLYVADTTDLNTPLVRSDYRSSTDSAISMAGVNYLEAGTVLVMRLYSASATNPTGNAKGTFTYFRAVYLSGGPRGDTGFSNYQIAQFNGFTGTEEEFLASLVGKTNYQIAQENGFTGTEAEWLESIKGEKGDTGPMGWSVALVLDATEPVPPGTANGTIIFRRL